MVRVFGSKINQWVSLDSASRITETGRVIFVAQEGQHSLANTHRDKCPKGQLTRSAIGSTVAEPREWDFVLSKGVTRVSASARILAATPPPPSHSSVFTTSFCSPSPFRCNHVAWSSQSSWSTSYRRLAGPDGKRGDERPLHL